MGPELVLNVEVAYHKHLVENIIPAFREWYRRQIVKRVILQVSRPSVVNDYQPKPEHYIDFPKMVQDAIPGLGVIPGIELKQDFGKKDNPQEYKIDDEEPWDLAQADYDELRATLGCENAYFDTEALLKHSRSIPESVGWLDVARHARQFPRLPMGGEHIVYPSIHVSHEDKPDEWELEWMLTNTLYGAMGAAPVDWSSATPAYHASFETLGYTRANANTLDSLCPYNLGWGWVFVAGEGRDPANGMAWEPQQLAKPLSRWKPYQAVIIYPGLDNMVKDGARDAMIALDRYVNS